MILRRANPARWALLALFLAAPLAACGKGDTNLPSELISVEPETPRPPSLLETTVAHAAYGGAALTTTGDTISVLLSGESEDGVSLTLMPAITTDTVVSYTLDYDKPLNLRLAKPDGTFEYGSTEDRSQLVLGPGGASEALLYTNSGGQLNLVVVSAQPCGGAVICSAEGKVAIRIDGAIPLLTRPFGASALSSPASGSVTAVRGSGVGEYGFSVAREAEGQEAYLLEFAAPASEPINVLVKNGEERDYISSNLGWVRVAPGSSVIAYTPRTGTFTFQDLRATACTPEEPRCQEETAVVPAP